MNYKGELDVDKRRNESSWKHVKMTTIVFSARPSIANARQDSFQRILTPKYGYPPIDDYASLKGPSLLKKTLGLQRHRRGPYIGFPASLDKVSFND